MMAAVVYARQSFTKEGSASLDSQVQFCTEAALRMGLEVVGTLVEPPSTSGFKDRGRDRQKFTELLEGFRSGRWQVVIAYKTDRLSRGGGPGWAPLLEAIEGAGLDVDRAIATPSGFVSEFEIGVRASMDREESKKLSGRMTDLAQRKAVIGLSHGSRRPFGYSDDHMTICEPEAALVRSMAARVLAGHGYNDVARWANEQGVLTTMGSDWLGVTVYNMLRKWRYAGFRSYHAERYPAKWEPIIELGTFERLQVVMDQRQRPTDKPKPRRYLLTGLLECGGCGGNMHGARKKDRPTSPVRRLYVCAQCRAVRRDARALEWYVRESIIYRLDSPQMAEYLKPDDSGQLKELLARRESQQAKLDGLVDDYAEGLLNKAQFARAKVTAQALLDETVRELDRALSSARGVELSAGETIRSAWEKSPDGWRRSVIGLVLKNIVVHPGKTKPLIEIDGRMQRFDENLIELVWEV